MIIIPDGHEPPIDAGHRIEQASGIPHPAQVRATRFRHPQIGRAAPGRSLTSVSASGRSPEAPT